jgi:hypothetical protein
MRFMVIVKANADSESGAMPSSDQLAAMGKFNEEMINAGIMLAGEGLHPSSKGARILYDGKGGASVTDGPFAESKELVAGFWIIQVKSRDEALAWIRKAPMNAGDELEIRQVQEVSDFDMDSVNADALVKEQSWRDATQKPANS